MIERSTATLSLRSRREVDGMGISKYRSNKGGIDLLRDQLQKNYVRLNEYWRNSLKMAETNWRLVNQFNSRFELWTITTYWLHARRS